MEVILVKLVILHRMFKQQQTISSFFFSLTAGEKKIAHFFHINSKSKRQTLHGIKQKISKNVRIRTHSYRQTESAPVTYVSVEQVN